MLLAIDVGNTNIVLGVFEGDRLVESWRLATDNNRSADEYGTIINSMFRYADIGPEDIDDVIISSVVPSLLFTLEHMCLKYYDKNPIVVEQGIKTGIKVRYDDPRQLGLRISVHDVRRGSLPAIVHPHVKGCVFHIGESPNCRIQLVGGNPQIKQDTVHLPDLKVI